MNYTDLAKELNRTEETVVKMLKKCKYLKENGKPRKLTIDAGLMREDGFIYKKGFCIFIEELGIKIDMIFEKFNISAVLKHLKFI